MLKGRWASDELLHQVCLHTSYVVDLIVEDRHRPRALRFIRYQCRPAKQIVGLTSHNEPFFENHKASADLCQNHLLFFSPN